MVDVALSTMLAFLGLLRTRAVLEEFRARSGAGKRTDARERAGLRARRPKARPPGIRTAT
jgi:hypothetical protein